MTLAALAAATASALLTRLKPAGARPSLDDLQPAGRIEADGIGTVYSLIDVCLLLGHRIDESDPEWPALSDAQRQPLMTMPTKQQVAERRALMGQGFIDLELRLLEHAVQHPDSSGRRAPHEVAARRAKLWRTHVLAGRSPTATAAAWEALMGHRLSRQQVARQVAAVEAVLG